MYKYSQNNNRYTTNRANTKDGYQTINAANLDAVPANMIERAKELVKTSGVKRFSMATYPSAGGFRFMASRWDCEVEYFENGAIYIDADNTKASTRGVKYLYIALW